MKPPKLHKAYEGYMEVFEIRPGSWLFVHAKGRCLGVHCCIHNPSDHPMVSFSMLWRSDRGLMERTCPHGIGHPDPDDIAFQSLEWGPDDARMESELTHGCDGCCGDSYESLTGAINT